MAAAPDETRAPATEGRAFIGIGIAGNDGGRFIPSRGENYRHVRRQEILDRWPVLPDDWARLVEETRLRL